MNEQTRMHLIAGLIASLSAVVLLALMDVNFCGWLGVWFVRKMPYIAGIPLALAVGFGASWAYGGSVAKTQWGPPPVRGLIFGVALSALFVWVMPWVFAELVGQATGVHTVGKSVGALDVFPETFGGHYAAIPNLDIDTPLENLADDAWYNKDDWKGRLIPFGISFSAMGLVLGLMVKGKRDK
ncbi:MAG: hypothetical protein DCC64_09525 [Planctomycetota bacterium]|nr:MAG: hypothetical protein DCC64_09525 [Planctomycetota bacterium]